MVREFIFNLFKNKQFLDLFFILIIYIINYIVVFKFGTTIIRSKINFKTLLITSIIIGFISLFLKAFVQEFIFGLIISFLIILIFFYYSSIFTFKGLIKSCWIFLIISIVMGLFMGIIFQPLFIFVSINFYNSTIGIIFGTILEFSPLLALLLFFNRKQSSNDGGDEKNEK